MARDLRGDGVDGMAIHYLRKTGTLVPDVVVLDEDYKGVDVRAYYTVALA